MRAIAIQDCNQSDRQELLKQMFQLRARIFADRLGWKVNVRTGQGQERDEFDRLRPAYILALTDDFIVAGCARLLPAGGATMLQLAFPQLLKAGGLVAHPRMVESSRFFVDTTLARNRGGRTLHRATLTMLAARGKGHNSNIWLTLIWIAQLSVISPRSRIPRAEILLATFCQIANLIANTC